MNLRIHFENRKTKRYFLPENEEHTAGKLRERREREREVANLHTKQLPPNPVVDGGVASAWAVSWPRRPGVLDISEGTTGVVG
jgi:hypothetical protein